MMEDLCFNRPEYIVWLHDSGKYEIDDDLLVQAKENADENIQYTEEG
jgi:hypothetical protein